MRGATEVEWATIEAELRVPLGRLRVIRYRRDEPFDIVGVADGYRLGCSLAPRDRQGGARFRDRWAPHRFAPLGDLYLIPPGQAVQARGSGSDGRSIVCEIDPAAFRDWYDGALDWTDRRLEASLAIASPALRTALLRIAGELLHPGLAAGPSCARLAAQAACGLARHCRAMATLRGDGGLAPWRLRRIDERLAADDATPSLAELAALCGLSRRQLTRGFRASRGRSIGDEIAAVRLAQAGRRLDGDAPIRDIAAALGFTSPAAFSTAFRRATGCSPRAYRRRLSRPLS